jgi:hypothetical protein
MKMEDAYALMTRYNEKIGTIDSFRDAWRTGQIPSEKLHIADDMAVDAEKLFNVSVADAIKYLQSFPKDAILEERWSGYEDNYFVVSKYVEESDETTSSRIFRAFSDYLKRRKSADDEAERQKRIKSLEAELARLKSGK